MRLAIPVDIDKCSVCPSFGRAPYFLFWDSESRQQQLLDNPAAQSQGGAGVQAAQFVVDQKADGVITIRCGENAAEVFQAADLQILKAEAGSAEENLAAWAEGRLSPLTHFHAGYHGIR